MWWGIQNEKTEGAKCLDAPLVYGVNYYAQEDSNLSCRCSWSDPKKGSFEVLQQGMRPIWVNKELVWEPIE